MGSNAVIKGISYILVHGPDFIIHNGTTQTTERTVNPSSEYLTALPNHIRSYEEAVNYPPNQVYIGNMKPEDLRCYEMPWYDKKTSSSDRYGKYGEIMPQDEFLGLVQICDVFDLVFLDRDFVESIKGKLENHPLLDENVLSRLKEGIGRDEIVKAVEGGHVEPLYNVGKLVGYVKRGHDIDSSLTAHILLENIVYKATGVLSLLYLVKNSGISKGEIDYVIDCSEEACGDMNQRGGGNFAKAEAEIAGLVNATGSDTRGFCAAPVHALIQGASLVKSGTYRNVVVFAGGTTAKLGMNGKDHVKKGLPVLEDVMGGFAVLISENDGINPEINTDIVGWHKVGTGSSPQAVISSLVTEPLEKVNLKITDIDKYAAEMQNPDITKPAGAGDVPEANYKMIAALGVRQGALERSEIADFVKGHGMPGWAPTQGHIPSGVPYLGFAREDILEGKIKRAMVIGKGSLFLGRMTNLFDGVSVVVQKNGGKAETIEKKHSTPLEIPVIGVVAHGSELGVENIHEGIALAERKGYRALIIEGEDGHEKMESMLEKGEIQGAVVMHYSFPIGISTVGRIVTPGKGKEMFIATTTGTSSVNRVEGMVKNAIHGIIAAKACGIERPTVGIANVDGARLVEKALLALKDKGYDIEFAESQRLDGGIVMRGNDLLSASSDVMVMDTLTGNLMVKIFSSYTTGGSYESLGYGYGPGIGEGCDRLIMIVSRASGAPVIAGSIGYADQLVRNGWSKIAKDEFAKANDAGLKDILKAIQSKAKAEQSGGVSDSDDERKEIIIPPKEIVTVEISGIDVMDIEDAAECLWEKTIYAETGMGCTGPVVLVNESNEQKAREILSSAGFITE